MSWNEFFNIRVNDHFFHDGFKMTLHKVLHFKEFSHPSLLQHKIITQNKLGLTITNRISWFLNGVFWFTIDPRGGCRAPSAGWSPPWPPGTAGGAGAGPGGRGCWEAAGRARGSRAWGRASTGSSPARRTRHWGPGSQGGSGPQPPPPPAAGSRRPAGTRGSRGRAQAASSRPRPRRLLRSTSCMTPAAPCSPGGGPRARGRPSCPAWPGRRYNSPSGPESPSELRRGPRLQSPPLQTGSPHQTRGPGGGRRGLLGHRRWREAGWRALVRRSAAPSRTGWWVRGCSAPCGHWSLTCEAGEAGHPASDLWSWLHSRLTQTRGWRRTRATLRPRGGPRPTSHCPRCSCRVWRRLCLPPRSLPPPRINYQGPSLISRHWLLICLSQIKF